MGKKGRRSARKTHSKGEAKRAAQQKKNQHKKQFIYLFGRGFRMDILAYAAGSIATIILVVAGFRYSEHQISAIVLVGLGILFLDIAMCLLWIDKVKKAPVVTETELHGLLIPANDPTPHTECRDIPSSAVILFLGNSVAYTTFETAAIKIRGQAIVSFANVPGGINVSARVYSQTNKVVAQITNNELYVNPSNLFHTERPDWHTLIVKDNQGDEVLHVYFINKNAIKVLGTFYVPGADPVIIEETRQIIGVTTSANCFGEVETAFDL
jgi:hypothetical protein